MFIHIIDIARMLDISTRNYEVMFPAAILFVIGYGLSAFSIPTLISKYPNIDTYRDKCLERANHIQLDVEFLQLEKLLDYSCLKIINPIFEILHNYLPIQQAVERGVAVERAVLIYATALYEINDNACPWLRLTVGMLLIAGFLGMNILVLISIIRLLGG